LDSLDWVTTGWAGIIWPGGDFFEQGMVSPGRAGRLCRPVTSHPLLAFCKLGCQWALPSSLWGSSLHTLHLRNGLRGGPVVRSLTRRLGPARERGGTEPTCDVARLVKCAWAVLVTGRCFVSPRAKPPRDWKGGGHQPPPRRPPSAKRNRALRPPLARKKDIGKGEVGMGGSLCQ
jgi:hypothetical protein